MAYTSCSSQCKASGDCDDCRDVKAVEKEIKQLKKMLRSAMERRIAILSQINSRRDPLTSRLPVEITCHIFTDYLSAHEMEPADYADYEHERPRYFPAIHRGAPLRLGHVCKRWRSIIWGYPELWTTLVVPLGCLGYALGPVMALEWLGRTGELPLSIQINYQDNEPIYTDDPEPPKRILVMDSARKLMRVIGQYSARWRNLDLTEAPLELLRDLEIRDEGGSILRHLCFGGHCADWNVTPQDRVQFKTIHSPTHLNLLSPIRPTNVNINWTNLTHLYVEGIARQSCYDVVRHVSATLLHLSVRTLDGDWTAYSTECMPKLVSLAIDEFDCQSNGSQFLFDCLTAPSLRSLSYIGNNRTIFPFRYFLRFLQHSSFVLQNLDLIHPNIPIPMLHRMLERLPSVQNLKLELEIDERYETATSKFFEILSQKNLKNEYTACLPHLSRFDLRVRPPTSWISLVGIFVDDPDLEMPLALVEEDSAATSSTPMRQALQLTLTVLIPHKYPALHEYVDILSLTSLACLWERYGVLCEIRSSKAEDPGEDSTSGFLVRSFDALLPTLAVSVAQQYESNGLREKLVAMSALEF